jgi:hypothetical protein
MTYIPDATGRVRCDYCGRTEYAQLDPWDIGIPKGWVTVLGGWHDESLDRHRCEQCQANAKRAETEKT